MFTIQEILDMAIRIEKNGEAVYRDAIEKMSDPRLESLLEWMADEEVGHAKWLAELKGLAENPEKNPFIEEMTRELLADQMGDQSFSLKEVDFSRVGGVDDLIAVFIEFENDGILFYEMLQPFIQDKDALARL
ncbi:MAG: ferritin family protein, partial [Desulfobacterales bacterium]|nr:ferritin family protein [Desulfobacterales bacterium]